MSKWIDHAEVHCGLLIMTISGHNYGNPCHPERSSCSGEFGCRSFKKHSSCTVCFLPCRMKKLACFYELFFLFFCFLFSWSSMNISLQDSILETETSGKSVKFNLPNYLVCKLSQIVNFDGFLTLMVWHFWQLLSCTANQITWTILTGILIGLL